MISRSYIKDYSMIGKIIWTYNHLTDIFANED